MKHCISVLANDMKVGFFGVNLDYATAANPVAMALRPSAYPDGGVAAV